MRCRLLFTAVGIGTQLAQLDPVFRRCQAKKLGASIDPRDRNGERRGLRLSYERIFIMLRIHTIDVEFLYTTRRRGEINGARVLEVITASIIR